MRKNNTLIATENATVCDMSTLIAFIINDKFATHYHCTVDSDCTDNDYVHVLRNNTIITSNKAHNHALHVYLKHTKQIVKIVLNRANFKDFKSDIDYVVQYKDKSLDRYVVNYENAIDLIRELCVFDSNRATTSATIENVDAIAK